MKFLSWRELARIDAELTASLVDTPTAVSHKIQVSGSEIDSEIASTLRQEMKSSYEETLKFFDIRPLPVNFSKDANHVSFGVFSKFSFSKNDILPGLTGFLASVKPGEIVTGYNDVSVFDHHTGPKIMLGAVAFINSSCRENCAYLSNSKRTRVQIRVTSSSGLKRGDEVTVLYGGEFFGPNRLNCECPHKEMHSDGQHLLAWTRSGRVRVVPELQPRVPISTSDVAVPKERVRRRDIGPTYQSRIKMKARYRVNYAESSSSSRISSSDEAPPEDVCLPLHFSQDRVFEISQADPIEIAPLQLEANPLFCSSPINCLSDFEETVPRIDSESSILPPSDSENDDRICRGSPCSVENFSIQLLDIADVHAFSERALKSVLDLFKTTLPPDNNLPTSYAMKLMEQRCSSVVNSEVSVSGTLINLCVKSQLNHLLLMNKDLIDHPYWPMQDDVALPRLKDQIVLYFVLSVDGVSPFNSAKFFLYPVWPMLLNLPARRRVCYRNLLQVTLFGGRTKPDCGNLMHNLISFFENFDGKMSMDGIDFCVQLKLKYVVVDAVMRAPLVNQTQFNGRYGCTHCVIVGEQAKTKAVWIYPFQKQGWPVRTLEGRKHTLDLKPSPLHPILGLKG